MATQHSPHEVAFGWNPRRPIDFIMSSPDPQREYSSSVPPSVSGWVEELKGQLRQIHDLVSDKQEASANMYKRQYDKNRKPLLFQPGDLVLLSSSVYPTLTNHCKHTPKYIGPFVVHQQIHPNSYKLSGLPPSVPKVQNVQHLKPFHPSAARFESRPDNEFARPQQVDGEVQWIVEAIVDHRFTRKGYQYKIKWADSEQFQ